MLCEALTSVAPRRDADGDTAANGTLNQEARYVNNDNFPTRVEASEAERFTSQKTSSVPRATDIPLAVTSSEPQNPVGHFRIERHRAAPIAIKGGVAMMA